MNKVFSVFFFIMAVSSLSSAGLSECPNDTETYRKKSGLQNVAETLCVKIKNGRLVSVLLTDYPLNKSSLLVTCQEGGVFAARARDTKYTAYTCEDKLVDAGVDFLVSEDEIVIPSVRGNTLFKK